MDLDIKLSPKEILNKSFNYNTNGYSPKEVDEYLDEIMEDYTKYNRYIRKMKEEMESLYEENKDLKNELRKLSLEFESLRESGEVGKYASTNVDLLKRISNLEKIVYGKNE